MASSANSLLLSVLVLVLGLVVSHAVAQSLIRMVPPENLLPKGDRRARADNFRLFCDSWRLSVENNNAGAWSSIPDGCLSNVEGYVTGDKYQSDLRVAAADSLAFAKTVKIAGDGLDVWVFDIDDTLLSSLSYYQKYGFGTYNETAYEEWVEEAGAPALQPSLRLYEDLQRLGFEIVLLTGRDEYQRKATVKNLLSAGYSNWNRLYLRGDADQGKKAILYKSEKRLELVNEGYRIHGSSGDQWSDLLGFALAERSFKLPNPMYYIA